MPKPAEAATAAAAHLRANVPAAAALPPLTVCQQARLSRDARFDGRFFVAVVTTGIYCRPICAARMPREDNVLYFSSAAAAQDAGFRPCRRCRPEAARRLPEWTLSSDTVLRGLRLIEAGYLNDHSAAQLARELHVGDRQLTRLFARELGTTPKSVARLSRARLARHLLATTRLPLAQVACHAGYGSASRFNHEIRQIFHCTPRELRRPASRPRVASELAAKVAIKLPIRAPYDFDWMFSYLQRRALAGIEEVSGGRGAWCYRRLLESPAAEPQWLEVRFVDGDLVAHVPLVDEPLHSLVNRVGRVFDLHADGAAVHGFLRADPLLGRWVERAPGLRVPGAWDGFETAVRAVLGQQVSVARGTVLANKLIARYGDGRFPGPAQLLRRDVAELGMPGRRGRAIVTLAEMAAAGELVVDDCRDFDAVQQQLEGIDGIGPWTANYIRMRAMKDPDAFPDNDWVVLKQLDCTAATARARARAWQPWRAYALMYLWQAAALQRAAGGKTGGKGGVNTEINADAKADVDGAPSGVA